MRILHGTSSVAVSHAQIVGGIDAAGTHADSPGDRPDHQRQRAADGDDSEENLHRYRLGQVPTVVISPPRSSRPC